MMRRSGFVALGLAALMAVSVQAQDSRSQDPRPQETPRPEPERPGMMKFDPHVAMDLQRRLQELDRKLSLGSVSQAQALITDLEQHSIMPGPLVTRRARLAQLQGDHAGAIRIAREGLNTQPTEVSLWRYLAGSLLVTAQTDSARIALDGFMKTSPELRSAGTVGIDMCLQTRRYRMAAGLIDSLRGVLEEPRYAALQKSQALLALDRKTAAAVEISAALREQPYNLSLVRGRLLQGNFDPKTDGDFLQAMRSIADGPGSIPAEKILVANMLLVSGRAREATDYALALTADAAAGNAILQNAGTLVRELELLDHDDQYDATVSYLLEVMEKTATSSVMPRLLRQRAADRLAEVCQQALVTGRLGDDPVAAVERFNDLVEEVRKVNPASDNLYAAQLTLARYLKDTLKDPERAARRLERLLLDPDLPTAGVALTRLSLGECYLAAADTARGRAVLTQLGRDPDYRDAAGAAHFQLARLDLAEGAWPTARDRFAVVALDNPGAPYANDSLELGLTVAEELDNPSGGPEILELYAPCVLAQVFERPNERLAALRTFVYEVTRRVDSDEPQHMLERGLFELGGALAEADSVVAARRVLRTLYTEHPDSRYAARAMNLAGQLLQAQGRLDEARDIWTRLLVQYPDDLFLADVREELENLKELP